MKKDGVMRKALGFCLMALCSLVFWAACSGSQSDSEATQRDLNNQKLREEYAHTLGTFEGQVVLSQSPGSSQAQPLRAAISLWIYEDQDSQKDSKGRPRPISVLKAYFRLLDHADEIDDVILDVATNINGELTLVDKSINAQSAGSASAGSPGVGGCSMGPKISGFSMKAKIQGDTIVATASGTGGEWGTFSGMRTEKVAKTPSNLDEDRAARLEQIYAGYYGVYAGELVRPSGDVDNVNMVISKGVTSIAGGTVSCPYLTAYFSYAGTDSVRRTLSVLHFKNASGKIEMQEVATPRPGIAAFYMSGRIINGKMTLDVKDSWNPNLGRFEGAKLTRH